MGKPPMQQGSPDDYQTPPYALKPLLPYVETGCTVWEPACGGGYLVNALRAFGYQCVGTDILMGKDYLTCEPPKYDVVITNPPFSVKQQFLERSYSLGKPFALLLPLTTFETPKRQALFRDYGVEVIFFDKRINFITPNKAEKSSAWFATAWFTWGLKIGKELTFAELDPSGWNNEALYHSLYGKSI